ncbi:MAG: MATE family efflux transporter [Muribaculaceae bacterium]|nr:MATE family efflux transporter [Muribaculaceae bacterium]
MTDSSDNKRIAKNTLFLYVRMLVVMFVTFFTSRVILEALGVDGYGVYSLVGGLAFSFGFFSSSLSNATQRYLSFAHGKNGIEEVRTIFNATAVIYLLLGGLTLTVGCLIGPFLISRITIPESMVTPAYWVYYCCIVSLTVTLTATMFDSVLIARENMKVYAYLSIFDVFGKLAIAYMIFLTAPGMKLIIYAIDLMVLTFIVKGVMIFFCITRYPECRIKLHWDKANIKELLGFIGWNGVGTAVYAVNDQGVNLLLNIFFGPVVNAARGVAYQVNTAITHFSQNFLLAISPQMMKSYARQEMTKFMQLFVYSGKFSFAMLWVLFLPVIMRRHYILHLWLKDVPDYTGQFLVWIIVYSLVNAYNYPSWFAIQAVGRLRKFTLITNTIFLLIVPVSWVILKVDPDPVIVFQVMAADRLLINIVALFILRGYYSFSIPTYIRQSVLPNMLLVLLTVFLALFINSLIPQSFIGFILNSLLLCIICCGAVWLIVLSKQERGKISSMIRAKLHI